MECKSKSDTSINRATGAISKPLRQHLSSIPGKNKIKELPKKKKAILGTAHILRKVLIQKYKTYFTVEVTFQLAQIVNTEQLQHSIP